MELIIGLLSFGSGIILGFLGHRYQVVQGKISIQRERLLINISKVEDFLNQILELEYSNHQHNYVRKEVDEIEKRTWSTEKVLSKIQKAVDEHTKLSRKISKKQLISSSLEKRRLASDKKKLLEKLNENVSLLTKDRKRLYELQAVLADIKDRLQKINENIWTSDIETICKVVDSSGKLSKLLNDLSEVEAKWSRDKKLDISDYKYQQQASNIRYKIRQLLNQKIQ